MVASTFWQCKTWGRPTRLAKTEAVGGAAKGEEVISGLNCADEAFEELADVLLNWRDALPNRSSSKGPRL
jgi:hypothetical protein